MEIIFRNFIKLLSNGAFGSYRDIEEMSPFKWGVLLEVAKTNEVSDYVCAGILKEQELGKTPIPQKIYDSAKGNGQPRSTDSEIVFLSSHFKQKKFSNVFLNKRLNKIIYEEMHRIDTSVETLGFLDKAIDVSGCYLTFGIDVKALVGIGLCLRHDGDKIDFVKLDAWVKLLNMEKMMNVLANLLVCLFRFEPSELPFLYKENAKLRRSIYSDLAKHTAKVDYAITNKGLQLSELRADFIGKPSFRMLSHFSLHPLESSSRFVGNIYRSLSNIEE